MIRQLVRKAYMFALLLPLANCAAVTAYHARDALLGMNVVDLQACAGVPDKTRKLDDRELLLQYDYKASDPAFSMQVFSQFSLRLGASGECHALFRILRDGTVAGVNYSGTTATLAGPYGACSPLVKECVAHPDQTALPAGYDAFDALLESVSKK